MVATSAVLLHVILSHGKLGLQQHFEARASRNPSRFKSGCLHLQEAPNRLLREEATFGLETVAGSIKCAGGGGGSEISYLAGSCADGNTGCCSQRLSFAFWEQEVFQSMVPICGGR